MGTIGGSIASGVTNTLNITSGSSSSSNSLKDACQEGKPKKIDINEEDLNLKIFDVYSIEVPSTNSKAGSQFLNVAGKVLTGSKFVHQGLIFRARMQLSEEPDFYYVCQTYPIQLVKCNNFKDAVDKIKSYWQINKDVPNKNLRQTNYDKKEFFRMRDVKEVVEKLPNKYDLFNYNCQHFCNKIIEQLRLKAYKHYN